MTNERFVVIGVATARADWFRATSQWATTSALPIEFLRCVAVDEARARLQSNSKHSALVIDERISGLDRDLVETAKSNGCAVVVIASPTTQRSWDHLGVDDVITEFDFDRTRLLDSLRRVATPVREAAPQNPLHLRQDSTSLWTGKLVAVTGAGGTGVSTAAMAIAQGLASDPRQGSLVCLADFQLDAEMAMLHDALDVVPGLQELVDLHRAAIPSRSQIHDGCFQVEQRNYDLLLGLRNHRDWTILRRRTTEATLDSLGKAYRYVVADVGIDAEGEAETGSLDVEDRNTLSRVTFDRASVVVVVGSGTMKGLFALARDIRRLLDIGVRPEQLVAVVNHAPRSVRKRTELVTAFSSLVPAEAAERVSSPVFVSHRRAVDDAVRDCVRLPPTIVKPLTLETLSRVDRLRPSTSASAVEPVAVSPGSLGSHTEEIRP